MWQSKIEIVLFSSAPIVFKKEKPFGATSCLQSKPEFVLKTGRTAYNGKKGKSNV